MEVKKCIPFVFKPLAKTKTKPKPKLQTKPKPLPKAKTKPKSKTKLEVRGLTLENKRKLDTIYAKDLLRLVGNSLIKIMTIKLTIREPASQITLTIIITTRL